MKLARLAPLLLTVLAPCLSALSPPQAGRLPLPAPSGPLTFEPGTKEVGLDELLVRLAHLTGQELAMTQQDRQQLMQMKEPLESAAPVPEGEVYSFVEGLLARNGAILVPLTGGKRPILAVRVLGGDRRDTGLVALYVRVDALSELATHPALFVRLLLDLEHIDSRQVQTQIRQLQTDDTGTTLYTPVGERALILQGRASEMASLARLLLDADEAAGKHPPRPVAEGKEKE